RFIARRWAYARSIAPLASRHPDAVPALRADAASAVIVALVAAGRPRAAAALLAARALHLRRGLRAAGVGEPGRLAAELALAGAAGTARGASHALRRVWSPLVLLAAAVLPRRALGLLVLAETVEL